MILRGVKFMGKFSLCELLRIIDEIEFKELRPILDKKCGPCKQKKPKKECKPPKCR